MGLFFSKSMTVLLYLSSLTSKVSLLKSQLLLMMVMHFIRSMHNMLIIKKLWSKHGVELQGWTFDKFASSSSLSTSLSGLHKLLNAINNGECEFVKLSSLKIKKWCDEHEKQILEKLSTEAYKMMLPKKTQKAIAAALEEAEEVLPKLAA